MSEIIEENGNGTRCSVSSESEDEYKPIITLPEVVISTNEEDEVELLKVRAKLYRWDAHGDPAEWKERGTGDLKILRHTGNNNVRIVMRRDKTLKVCANHFIVPWLELTPKSGTDKAFVYSVIADFADERAKSETFAVKFGNIDNANLFKSKFEEGKEIVKTKCSLYNGEDENEQSDGDESEKSSDEDNDKKDDETLEVSQKLSELEVSKNEEKSEE